MTRLARAGKCGGLAARGRAERTDFGNKGLATAAAGDRRASRSISASPPKPRVARRSNSRRDGGCWWKSLIRHSRYGGRAGGGRRSRHGRAALAVIRVRVRHFHHLAADRVEFHVVTELLVERLLTPPSRGSGTPILFSLVLPLGHDFLLTPASVKPVPASSPRPHTAVPPERRRQSVADSSAGCP